MITCVTIASSGIGYSIAASGEPTSKFVCTRTNVVLELKSAARKRL
jgi:hypothetical protein